MKINLLFSIVLLSVGCGAKNESLPTSTKATLSSIVSGENVDPATTETRYIVSLNHKCGGSIIAPKWILTAAHCESDFKNVSGGGIDKYARKRIRLKVKNSYTHPKYRTHSWGARYDYALIELKHPIDFEATGLKSIKLADSEFENAGGLNEGTKVTALGWGATSEGGSESDILQKVELQVLNYERANGPLAYKGKLDDSMFVAGDPEGKKDACQGDSGGPLTAIHPTTGEIVLAGIVSWGDVCASKKFPGVYSRVSHVLEWINQTISK